MNTLELEMYYETINTPITVRFTEPTKEELHEKIMEHCEQYNVIRYIIREENTDGFIRSIN